MDLGLWGGCRGFRAKRVEREDEINGRELEQNILLSGMNAWLIKYP